MTNYCTRLSALASHWEEEAAKVREQGDGDSSVLGIVDRTAATILEHCARQVRALDECPECGGAPDHCPECGSTESIDGQVCRACRPVVRDTEPPDGTPPA